MALKPEDRYASVADLAADVERWLADEQVTAYRQPAGQRLCRWARKHQARVAGAAAAAVVGTLALAVGLVLVTGQNRALAAARGKENEARKLADQGFAQARAAVDEFFVEISQNKDLLGSQPGMQALRQTLLGKARRYYQGFLQERGSDPTLRAEAAVACYRLGWITEELGPGKPEALAAYEEGVKLREQLVLEHPGDAQHLFEMAKLLANIGRYQARMDQFDDALTTLGRARELVEPLVRDHPTATDYPVVLGQILGVAAIVHGRKGNLEKAIKENAQTVEILERLSRDHAGDAEYARRLGLACTNLGLDLMETGRLHEALAYEVKAVEAAERAARLDPRSTAHGELLAVAYTNLGVVQTKLNRQEQSLASFTKAVATAEKLARENPAMANYTMILIHNRTNLGEVQLRWGRLDESLASFGQGVADAENLVARTPGVAEYELELVKCYGSLGSAQLLRGKPDALATFRRGLALAAKLARSGTEVPEYAHYQASFEGSLGWLHHGLSQAGEAAAHFARALEIRERLVRDKPDVANHVESLARLLATVPVSRLRDPSRAVALARKVVAQAPDNTDYQATFGVALYRAGDGRGAVATLSKLRSGYSPHDASNVSTDFILALAHGKLSENAQARECFGRAAAWMDKHQLAAPDLRDLRAEAARELKIVDTPPSVPQPKP
jgi:tetratricopeptide (TPR) repeat protein